MNRFIAVRASMIIAGVFQPTLWLAALFFYAWDWSLFWVVLPFACGSAIPALPVLCSDPKQEVKFDKASFPRLILGVGLFIAVLWLFQQPFFKAWMDQIYLRPYLNKYMLAGATLIAGACVLTNVRKALRLRPSDEY
ncbi:MAG: hypothetical protein JWO08_4133 [Verrucomicrobiaceae bacterium]|nr:hypothetical protein [Verrucomicrobiaceae bacterium]